MGKEISVITTGVTLPQTLAEYRAMSEADRQNLTGQGGTLGNQLPRLKINYDSEVEIDGGDTVNVPRGQWTITIRPDEGEPYTAYAEEVTIRVFLRGYRYMSWNRDTEKLEVLSSIFRNWQDPVVDDLGNEFAGGKYKKGMLAAYPEYAADGPAALKCQQVLYSLVTFKDAKDLNGKKVTIKDVPAVYIAKGSAFMPLSDIIDELKDSGRDMGEWTVSMTTLRQKKGSVVYFVPVPVVGKETLYTEEEFILLKKFEETLNFENIEILSKYRKRIEAGNAESVASEVVSSGDLSDDFGDELPESMQGD